jgi:hypothetical protein
MVVQGSTSMTFSSPRAIAWSSLACLPGDPRNDEPDEILMPRPDRDDAAMADGVRQVVQSS